METDEVTISPSVQTPTVPASVANEWAAATRAKPAPWSSSPAAMVGGPGSRRVTAMIGSSRTTHTTPFSDSSAP
jgi:hypothetical protein